MFKQIAEKVASYLNIRPDRDEVPGAAQLTAATNGDQAARAVAAHTP